MKPFNWWPLPGLKIRFFDSNDHLNTVHIFSMHGRSFNLITHYCVSLQAASLFLQSSIPAASRQAAFTSSYKKSCLKKSIVTAAINSLDNHDNCLYVCCMVMVEPNGVCMWTRLTCPAVSHNCSRTGFPSTWTTAVDTETENKSQLSTLL